MEEIITKGNLDTYTQGLKGVLSSMGEAINEAGNNVQGSIITINLVSEGFDISYVLATSGSKVLGQLQNGDSVVIPFGAEYELTPHLSNGTDKFPKRGVATKMEETVTVYGSGYDRVDLGLPSGKLWATCNIGADSPEKSGMMCQYGYTKLYMYGESAQTSFNPNKNISGDVRYDAAAYNMGGDWRMPTKDEWSELSSYCRFGNSIYNGVVCLLVIGRNQNTIVFPNVPSDYSKSAWSYYMTSTNYSSGDGKYHYYTQVATGIYYPSSSTATISTNTTGSNSTLRLVRAIMNAPQS